MLSSSNYIIRPLRESDVNELADFINRVSTEPEIMISSRGVNFSLEEERDYVRMTLKEIFAGKAIYLVVENLGNGQIIGSCDVRKQDLAINRHTGRLGIIIDQKFRSQGLGYKLARATMKQAKEMIGDLKLITLEVFEQNLRARQLYEKLGFKEYGMLPDGIINADDQTENMILMYRKI